MVRRRWVVALAFAVGDYEYFPKSFAVFEKFVGAGGFTHWEGVADSWFEGAVPDERKDVINFTGGGHGGADN